MSRQSSDTINRVRAKLAGKHVSDEDGLWSIHGEDPNCDMGGSHIEPLLETVEGKYGDVLDYALSLDGFIGWGAGGSIRKIEVRKRVDSETVGKRALLLKKRAALQSEIDAIEQELKMPTNHAQESSGDEGPRALEGCRRLVFDDLEWSKVGHDVGDNSCFWKPATILRVMSDGKEWRAVVEFDGGRKSYGHFVNSMREI